MSDWKVFHSIMLIGEGKTSKDSSYCSNHVGMGAGKWDTLERSLSGYPLPVRYSRSADDRARLFTGGRVNVTAENRIEIEFINLGVHSRMAVVVTGNTKPITWTIEHCRQQVLFHQIGGRLPIMGRLFVLLILHGYRGCSLPYKLRMERLLKHVKGRLLHGWTGQRSIDLLIDVHIIGCSRLLPFIVDRDGWERRRTWW
jgi:hypothetical protein